MRYLPHVLTCALLTWGAAAVAAQGPKGGMRDNPKVMQAFHDVVAKPSAATVRVLTDGKQTALGVIVGSDGWILTKWDDLKDKKKITCKLKDGKELEAQLVGVENNFDLALLRVEARGLPTIEWRSSKEASVGKLVVSVGPSEGPVAIGIVSVATRKYKFGDQPPKYLKTNSGYLGVTLAEGEGGAKIMSIAPKSPAAKANLKVNDIVYEAAGHKVIDTETFINTIQRHKPGDAVLLKVKRKESTLEIKAVLEKMPKGMLGINPQEFMGNTMSHRRGSFPVILQHDTVLKPADCGGPLVDLDSKAVGLNISRAGRTETYAIPSEVILSLLDDLKSGRLAWKEGPLPKEPMLANPVLVLRNRNSLIPTDSPNNNRKGGAPAKVYEVYLPAGVPHLIELDSAEFDTYLILENEAGKKLVEDNNSGGELNARLLFTPEKSGIYRIVATAFAPGETGIFTLTIRKQGEPKPTSSAEKK